MRRSRRRSKVKEDAELNITSFMNLMVVLVPVLLLNMVFSHISVLDLRLPNLSDSETDKEPPEVLELIVTPQAISLWGRKGDSAGEITVPDAATGQLVPAKVLKKDGEYDYKQLQTYLKEIKRRYQESGEDKKDIFLLSTPKITYQTIVSIMDSVKSYETVQAASLVEAELFPDVSLGDAPDDAAALLEAGLGADSSVEGGQP